MTTTRTERGLLLVVASEFGNITIGQLATGTKGIDQTAAAMRGIVKASKPHAPVKRFADNFPTLDRLYAWVRAHQHFVADPKGVELIREPCTLLNAVRRKQEFAGDCDDVATLLASAIAAWGETPVIAVIGPTPREAGGRFKHVFAGMAWSATAQARGFRPSGGFSVKVGGKSVAVSLLDPQENRAVGHVPKEAMQRLYVADGEHA